MEVLLFYCKFTISAKGIPTAFSVLPPILSKTHDFSPELNATEIKKAICSFVVHGEEVYHTGVSLAGPPSPSPSSVITTLALGRRYTDSSGEGSTSAITQITMEQ